MNKTARTDCPSFPFRRTLHPSPANVTLHCSIYTNDLILAQLQKRVFLVREAFNHQRDLDQKRRRQASALGFSLKWAGFPYSRCGLARRCSTKSSALVNMSPLDDSVVSVRGCQKRARRTSHTFVVRQLVSSQEAILRECQQRVWHDTDWLLAS